MSTESEDITSKVPKNVPCISSLNIYLKLSKFFGIILFENSSGTKIKSIIPLVHIFLKTASVIILHILLGTEKIRFLKSVTNFGLFGVLLHYADIVVLIMIHFSILLSNIWYSEDSKSLLRDLSRFDRHLMEVFAIEEKRNGWRVCIFYCFTFCGLIIFTLEIFSHWKELTLKIFLQALVVHIPNCIGMLYRIIIICFFWELSFVFGRRYQLLKEFLEEIFKKQEIHILREDLEKFKYLYRVLFMEVCKINQVFGPVLVCLVSKMIFDYLINFYWIISDKIIGHGWFIIAQSITKTVSIQFFLISQNF